MDREDIIRMAREAGFRDTTSPIVALSVSWEQVQRFAALVAAHERQERHAAWHEGFEAGQKAERAFCAAVCDEKEEAFKNYYVKGLPALCASAIRARGNT